MATAKTKIPLKPLNKKNARILFAALFCFALGATGSLVTQKAAQSEVNAAVSQAQIAADNAQTQAKNIRDTLCYDKVDKRSEICVQAQQVIDDPKTPAPPIKGEPGAAGLGIVSSAINASGNLVVTYTDGKTSNLGKVVGADGKTGADGKPGADGKNGAAGTNGISVTAQTINASGNLIVTYSNGVSKDLGYVVGPTGAVGLIGPQGATGATGVAGDTGPPGPQGPQGEPGTNGTNGTDGTQGEPISSFTFTNGGVTYTCTPNPPGSTTYTCSANGPVDPPVVEPEPSPDPIPEPEPTP